MPITTATQMRWTSTAGALKGEGGGRAREWGGEGGREQRGRGGRKGIEGEGREEGGLFTYTESMYATVWHNSSSGFKWRY